MIKKIINCLIKLLILFLLVELCLGNVVDTKGNSAYVVYDSKNFLCDHYHEFCAQILGEIGCSKNQSERINKGCYPGKNLATDYVGKCTCLNPIYFDAAGIRVSQQLIQNRIGADISWMLEPWSSGPPYDMVASFNSICDVTLDRLGCPQEHKVINASNHRIVNGERQSHFECSCGKFTEAGPHIIRMIMDKFNLYHMQSTPVFSDPVYFSVPVSLCVTLICGKIGGIIAVYLKLPPIIGFLLAGVSIQNVLNPMFLKGSGYPFPSPASELKTIALVIVLMRAGLSIKFDEIYATAYPTLLLCTIPYFMEFLMWMVFGPCFFSWNMTDLGLWASIMAPLGPSVVISGLLLLLGNQKKDYGYPTKQILITTPIEAVIAIVLFGIFQNLEQTSRNSLFPWVQPLSGYSNWLMLPVNIAFSIIVGGVIGIVCSRYINWRVQIKSDYIWNRVNKNPQMGSSTADLVFVLVVLCYTMYSLCTMQYIRHCSGVLVVFITCITVSILANDKTVLEIAQGLKGIWIFAEVFLFTLTGTSLSIDPSNGPLYGQRGLSSDDIHKVLKLMFLGSFGRFIAICIVVSLLYSYMPPHRQNWKWMSSFALVCWIFQLPKATVQATLGSVAYYQNTIPGDEGLKEGLFIAQTTAFTVLVFAPLGALLTNYVGAPIAAYLTRLDKEAGWLHNEFRYAKKLESYEDDDVDAIHSIQMSNMKTNEPPLPSLSLEEGIELPPIHEEDTTGLLSDHHEQQDNSRRDDEGEEEQYYSNQYHYSAGSAAHQLFHQEEQVVPSPRSPPRTRLSEAPKDLPLPPSQSQHHETELRDHDTIVDTAKALVNFIRRRSLGPIEPVGNTASQQPQEGLFNRLRRNTIHLVGGSSGEFHPNLHDSQDNLHSSSNYQQQQQQQSSSSQSIPAISHKNRRNTIDSSFQKQYKTFT